MGKRKKKLPPPNVWDTFFAAAVIAVQADRNSGRRGGILGDALDEAAEMADRMMYQSEKRGHRPLEVEEDDDET